MGAKSWSMSLESLSFSGISQSSRVFECASVDVSDFDSGLTATTSNSASSELSEHFLQLSLVCVLAQFREPPNSQDSNHYCAYVCTDLLQVRCASLSTYSVLTCAIYS